MFAPASNGDSVITPTGHDCPITPPKSTRQQILEEAIEYVCKDRQADHGKPENTFHTHAELWSAYIRSAHGVEINLASHDVAAMMVLFKVGRIAANPQHKDNWIDTAGYAACGGELAEVGE